MFTHLPTFIAIYTVIDYPCNLHYDNNYYLPIEVKMKR